MNHLAVNGRIQLTWHFVLMLILNLSLLGCGDTDIQSNEASQTLRPTQTRASQALKTLDFDGDGRTDLFGVGTVDPSARYSGTGDMWIRSGGLALPNNTLVGRNAGDLVASTFKTGDFNGDGKSDLLTIGSVDRFGRYTGSGSIFIRSGGTNLSVRTDLAVNRSDWTDYVFQVGDFDGDGKSDVLGIGKVDSSGRYTGSGCLFILYGGLGTFQTSAWICNVGAWNGYIFKVGDFSGDGKSDLLGIGAVDQYGRYIGSGGLFVRSGGITLPTETVWARSVGAWIGYVFQVGDFDGDLKSDVLGIGTVDQYGRYSGSGGLFVRSGGVTLPIETVWARSVGAWANYVFQVGDFDGDLKSDVLGIGTVDQYGRYSGSGGLFIRSGGIALPIETVWARSIGAWINYLFDIGDFDGDGKSDVMLIGTVDTFLRYSGSGGMVIRSGGLTLPNTTLWSSSVPSWSSYQLSQKRPYADPTNVAPISFVYPVGYTPAVVDLNGDGWVEPFGLLNDRGGSLIQSSVTTLGLQDLSANGRARRDNRVADFNGDGLLDMINNTYSCTDVANPNALLYFNNGDGTFRNDPSFTALGLRGRGETIVTADFNNDGFLDLYLPYYTDVDATCANADHNPLLINDGTGHFQDIGVSAGVGLHGAAQRPEGAQAVDFNGDGWIDLYVSSHLFINNKNNTFSDLGPSYGLPASFDEGAKFLDWNNDGKLDLVLMHPANGLRLFEFNGTSFVEKTTALGLLETGVYTEAYGINAYDLDNDGREDLLVMGGTTLKSKIFLNIGTGFVRSNSSLMTNLPSGQAGMSLADINRDGQIDIVYPNQGLTYFPNTLPTAGRKSMSIEVFGSNGALNQQGRVIKVRPATATSVNFTRVIDGGSGYMAQTQYPILVGTPYVGTHTVEVAFAPLTPTSAPIVVSFSMLPGQRARIYAPSIAVPMGRFEVLNGLTPTPH
jgi:hypothetical protein